MLLFEMYFSVSLHSVNWILFFELYFVMTMNFQSEKLPTDLYDDVEHSDRCIGRGKKYQNRVFWTRLTTQFYFFLITDESSNFSFSMNVVLSSPWLFVLLSCTLKSFSHLLVRTKRHFGTNRFRNRYGGLVDLRSSGQSVTWRSELSRQWRGSAPDPGAVLP